MNQLDFYPPASHKNDPVSSFIAEEKVTKSGKRKANINKVYNGLKEYPSCTGAELAHYLNMDKYEVRRRLNDLHKLGKANQGEHRQCRIAKSQAVTWK